MRRYFPRLKKKVIIELKNKPLIKQAEKQAQNISVINDLTKIKFYYLIQILNQFISR
jgi:hypothetical protein